MSDTNYRIKLYGHASSDADFFLVELAAVLEIDPESARALLESVPVIIKEGLSLGEAEHLQDLLRIIKALSLLESTDGVYAPAQDISQSQQLLDDRHQQQEEHEKSETLRSYAWLGAAVLAAAVILVWLTGTFFSSYLKSSAENRTKVPVEKSENLEPPEPSQPVPLAASLSELYKQMESANQRIQSLEFLQHMAEDELQRLYSTYKIDPNLIREKKVEVASSRQKLRAEKTAYKNLKIQAEAIEATLKRSSN
ncbi:MAG: hypothetical protein HY912_19090 [Desulfomonile tiedjei]|uniref:Uncharacterized protein n=1 Tax=Desulfomonile tiedjei TaxID=2358 RepID=A0A9D6V9W1_9BACT|nr:hypothetical protein [Desulfomonile tiedjei]